jgi:hypothetical protein
MKELKYIFGSEPRVKIMRLFLFNEDIPYDAEEVSVRGKVSLPIARKEIAILLKIGFLQKKKYIKEMTITPARKGTPAKTKKKSAAGFMLNKKLPLVDPLRGLLIESNLVSMKDMPMRFKGAGQIKLLVLSGIFVRDTDRSVDLLLVGNKLDKKMVEQSMKILEAEIGKEIRYAIFEEGDFIYRMNMYDKLLRDIFDYEYKSILNKLDVRL